MFKKITSDTGKKDFMAIHMSSMCPSIHDAAMSMFSRITEDSYLILAPTDEGKPQLLGYFTLNSSPITASPQYMTLLADTLAQGGEDKTKEYRNMPSIHILDWQFDEALKQKEALRQIFSILILRWRIIYKRKPTMIWTDDGTFLFYILKKLEHDKAMAYLIDGFMSL